MRERSIYFLRPAPPIYQRPNVKIRYIEVTSLALGGEEIGALIRELVPSAEPI